MSRTSLQAQETWMPPRRVFNGSHAYVEVAGGKLISAHAGATVQLVVAANLGTGPATVYLYDNTTACGSVLLTLTVPADDTRAIDLALGLRCTVGLSVLNPANVKLLVTGRGF